MSQPTAICSTGHTAAMQGASGTSHEIILSWLSWISLQWFGDWPRQIFYYFLFKVCWILYYGITSHPSQACRDTISQYLRVDGPAIWTGVRIHLSIAVGRITAQVQSESTKRKAYNPAQWIGGLGESDSNFMTIFEWILEHIRCCSIIDLYDYVLYTVYSTSMSIVFDAFQWTWNES